MSVTEVEYALMENAVRVPQDPVPPPKIPSRYGRVQIVSASEIATSFRTHDQVIDRPVILTIVSPIYAADPAFVARFEREGELLASIDHPHVVRIISHGFNDGVLSLVTEDLPGSSLADLLRDRGPLAPAESVRITRQILSGINAIHAAGLLHLRLTSQNVFLGEDGNARITDVGLRSLLAESTSGHAIEYRYHAPEQIIGSNVSEASDVYSVGMVLYELLTGELPFTNDDRSLILNPSSGLPVPAPGGRTIAYVPPALDAISLRALAKDPADRYASAREMSDALQAVKWPEFRIVRHELSAFESLSWSAVISRQQPNWRSISFRNLRNGSDADQNSAPGRGVARKNWLWPVIVTSAAIILLIGAVVTVLAGDTNGPRGEAVAGVSLDAEESSTPTPRLIRALDEREPTVKPTRKPKSTRTPKPTRTPRPTRTPTRTLDN